MKHKTIPELRKKFEDIDKEILVLLGKRVQLSKEIAFLKKENRENVVQLNVWKEQLENRLEENNKLNIDVDFLIRIFNEIHEESIRIQNMEVEKLK